MTRVCHVEGIRLSLFFHHCIQVGHCVHRLDDVGMLLGHFNPAHFQSGTWSAREGKVSLVEQIKSQ